MIYLDHAATTRLDDDVLAEMLPYLTESFGNASSQHMCGRIAANALTSARDRIAAAMGAKGGQIYFTSGGTESDNWALRGIYAAMKGHIVLSAIEHPALLKCAEDLQKQGAEVTLVNPDSSGIVSPQSIKKAIKDDTVFVGVMSANNETGVIQPTAEIAAVCAERNIFFYCDCVQSAGVLPFVYDGVGGIGFSAHKFYGPKGAGVLWLKKGARVERLIAGGRQESGLRGGTSNVAAAVGCAAALEKAVKCRERNNKKIAEVRDYFLDRVLGEISGTALNGDRNKRLPSNANISFEGCSGDRLLALLDMRGICVSTGSACAAGATTPSHVLTAMGLSDDMARSSVRFTFGRENTIEDADKTVEALKEIVRKLRYN